MSELKPSPKMEEEATGTDFLVHTKHTCDVCFQAPILGKRFTSSERTNFDLCATCFEASYSGPEIVFAEEALERDKKQTHQFVLKLKIDDGGDEQVRRIKVADIWGKSTSHLSFGKMMSIAFSHAASSSDEVDGAGLDAFVAKAKATYIDEDGDRINMTSDAELEDAFRQVFKKSSPSPFRITVTLPKDEATRKVCMIEENARGMPKRIQVRKPSCKKPFSVSMDELPVKIKSKTTLNVTPQKFEKDFFIHARHTCDGCSKTPIIGPRYHAAKIPDFDLCGACFEKYEGAGEDDFKPEIQDRDRRMQKKWLKKQLSNSSQIAANIAGVWNKANGDLGEFLKQVQASGGIIESATVYAQPSAEDQSAPEVKNTENNADASANGISTPEVKNLEGSTVDEAGSLKAVPEPAKDDAPANPPGPGWVSQGGHWVSPALGIEFRSYGPAAEFEELRIRCAGNEVLAWKEYQTMKKGGRVPKMVDETGSLKAVSEPAKDDAPANMTSPAVESEKSDGQSAPGSPTVSRDESFLSDADGNGSIAEAIGRTLDVCVAAIEEAMDDIEKVEASSSSDCKASADKDFAVDAFSVASSMVSGMTDALKKMEEPKKTKDFGDASKSDVPSVVSGTTGATIVKSEDGTGEEKGAQFPETQVASFGEDEWSIVEDEKAKAEPDAAESVSSIDCRLLAKWDSELYQLHELGFLDDGKNVDVLEALEASHVAVDSTEKVTINAALGRLLGDR